MTRPRRFRSLALGSALVLLAGASLFPVSAADTPPTALIGLGDSLTHGTMDATNNALNTENAYLQRARNALAQRIPLVFSQPFFDVNEERIDPRRVPTNLAVDGADSFTLEGLDYYKRAGTEESLVSADLLADKLLPSQFEDKYDKVIYPINLLARRPITQIGAAEWLLKRGLPAADVHRAITVYWVGNNDSSTSALGFGGANPVFAPLPADQLRPVLPGISLLLKFGERLGLVSLEPYSAAAIDRNLTALEDFVAQQEHLVSRLLAAGEASGVDNQVFLLTLPYYSAIGYLFDSEDIEYYLGKANPAYRVPPSFARVAPRGQPITDPLKGDRISLLTFGMMYALLETGFPVGYVNGVLEEDGAQNDGLVLSEAEVGQVMTRIDGFNATIRTLAQTAGPNVHLVDVGPFLSDVLTGKIPLTIGGHEISRKWIRGSAFGFDGVHPGYAGQALIANFVLSRINADLGLDAPLASLDEVISTDPYVDRDGDGWAAGPDYQHPGITDVLFLFKDPDDSDATAQVDLPDDVWVLIRNALLGDLLGREPALRPEAERLGLIPVP
jgi:lysophospholipase L1-like esterase